MTVSANLDRATARTNREATVLHVRVLTGVGGGPEKTLLNSPRSLRRLGYRAHCAFLHPPGDPGFEHIRQRGEERQANIVSISDRGPWDWRVVRRLLQLCRRHQVDLWHGHDYKSNALGLLIRRFWPMRLVTTVHGWVKHTWKTPLYYWVDRRCLRHYDRVVCVSHDLLEKCEATGVPSDRCLFIENAIDLGEFSRRMTTGEAKRLLGFSPQRVLIGSVGRLSAEKGFDLLLRAVARLVQSGLDAELAILGDGDQRGKLAGLARSLGLGDRVHLLGYQSNPGFYMQAMDIFASSSRREGLPNVLLEAMALELPVVATRSGGVQQLIASQENGLLVDVGAVEPLADALQRLVVDEDLRRRLATAGRQCVCENYSFARRMLRMTKVYDELLGVPQTAASVC